MLRHKRSSFMWYNWWYDLKQAIFQELLGAEIKTSENTSK